MGDTLSADVRATAGGWGGHLRQAIAVQVVDGKSTEEVFRSCRIGDQNPRPRRAPERAGWLSCPRRPGGRPHWRIWLVASVPSASRTSRIATARLSGPQSGGRDRHQLTIGADGGACRVNLIGFGQPACRFFRQVVVKDRSVGAGRDEATGIGQPDRLGSGSAARRKERHEQGKPAARSVV